MLSHTRIPPLVQLLVDHQCVEWPGATIHIQVAGTAEATTKYTAAISGKASGQILITSFALVVKQCYHQ